MSVQQTKPVKAQGITHTNPRRPAPEFSVSLRHPVQPTQRPPGDRSDDEPCHGGVNAASRVGAHGGGPIAPSQPATETRNAEKWFDESNNNAGGKTNVRIIDDDPPFYLPKQRSSDEDGSQEQQTSSRSDSRPVGMGPAGLDSSGGSVDEYRSVIDDLTVENQELKRRLRKYEGLHSAHLQDDKLFEVRVYKLSQARRRRLESMLREFVANIARSPPAPDSNSSGAYPPFAALPYQYAPAPAGTKRSGSSASNKPVDSAYASMSQSGPASVSQAQPNTSESRGPIRPAAGKVSTQKEKPTQPPQDQRVRSYLQTMSRRLLPKYPPVMTEKTKKRLIVKRLEQLFVGRSDSSTKLSQSYQQEEVSQSAATADRRETEAMGHHVQAEGRREAKMLRNEQSSTSRESTNAHPSRTESSNTGGVNSSAATPDQRPTRPLDLDPSRAQNPTETISYMKHLGFQSPKMNPVQPQGEQEGWIFLNLLINMAQLHTLNVTPGFVRTAIQELSSNFELSEDGQNIRWKGGPRISKLSSDSSVNSDESVESTPNHPGQTREKQPSKQKTGTATEGDASRTREKQQQQQHSLPQVRHWLAPQMRLGEQQYSYSPLFYNPDEYVSISPTPENVSSNSNPLAEDRSGGVSGESTSQENTKTSSKMATDGETGNLIFYQRARFYTDLKGDPTFAPANTVYEKYTEDMLGIPPSQSQGLPFAELKGDLSNSESADVVMSDSGMEYVNELHGFESLITFSSNPPKPPHPTPLPMSGVGGVSSSDNFCIAVLQNHRKGKVETMRTMLKDLGPTPLPPPSYAMLPYSSSSSDTGDSDSDDDDDLQYQNSIGSFAAELNETRFVPPAMLGEFSSRSTGKGNHAHHSQGTGTSDESSLDMLQFARKADPDGVARHEREYDAMRTRSVEMDEDSGEDHAYNRVPPSGSVAATIGDRSTFLTSQEDNASVDERHRRFLHERKTSNLKREHSDWGDSQRANKQTRTDAKV